MVLSGRAFAESIAQVTFGEWTYQRPLSWSPVRAMRNSLEPRPQPILYGRLGMAMVGSATPAACAVTLSRTVAPV